jgi:hypothetical protein
MYGAPHLLLLAWRWLQSQLLGLGFSSIPFLARLLFQLLRGVVAFRQKRKWVRVVKVRLGELTDVMQGNGWWFETPVLLQLQKSLVWVLLHMLRCGACDGCAK